MKKWLALLLAALLVLSVAGCKPNGGGEQQESEKVDPYNDLTMDELYELAKAEGGKITVYSTTTDASSAAKKFKKAYPDLEIEFISCDTNTIAEKLVMESDSGNINADVVCVKDNSGEIYNELVLYDVLGVYKPTAVCEHIDPELLRFGLPLYATFNPWFYNTRMFPDGCPLTSWWDIVEGYDVNTHSYTDASGVNHQKWTIFTKDITGPSYASLWTQIIIDGDKMAEQYKKQYGTDLVYTYHDALANTPGIMEFPENNAGVELFYRFTQMKITELSDGDGVVEAVHNSLNGPTLGLTSASKLDNRDSSGFEIAWVTGLEPYTAFQACSYLYTVEGSNNPYGARLFIQFCLGGADGQTGCYTVFDKRGAWSVRDDVVYTKSDMSVEEVNLTTPDFARVYETYPNVKSYWTYWSSLAKN